MSYHICICRLLWRPAPGDSCTCDSACWTVTVDHAWLDSRLPSRLLLTRCHVSCAQHITYTEAASALITHWSSSQYSVIVEKGITGRSIHFFAEDEKVPPSSKLPSLVIIQQYKVHLMTMLIYQVEKKCKQTQNGKNRKQFNNHQNSVPHSAFLKSSYLINLQKSHRTAKVQPLSSISLSQIPLINRPL